MRNTDDAGPSTDVSTWAVRGLGLVLLAVLGLFLFAGATALAVPDLLETGEPWVVSAAYYAGTGGGLYSPVDGLPFIHNNYNPLAQLLVAPVLARTGPAFWPMRALSLAAALGILVLAGRTARRECRGPAPALVAALLPLSCGFALPWLCLGRVDVVAALGSVGAACWAFSHRDGGVRRRGLWVVFAWIAFASKQTMLAAPAAILLETFLAGRRREALVLGTVYAAGVLGIVGLAQALSGGQYWLHAVVYNASHDRGGFWPAEQTPGELFWAFGPALLAMALVALAAPRAAGRPWLVWMIVAGTWAFFLVRKSGSHVHYFLETVVAVSIAGTRAGAALLDRWRADRRTRRLLGAAAFMVLLAAGVLASAHRHHWQQAKHLAWLRTRQDPVPAEIRRRLREAEGPCLLTAKLGSLAIEAGKPAIFDIADFVRLQELGRWSARTTLVPLVEGKRFPLIGLAEFPGDHAAAPHFDARRIEGLVPAIERSYRRLDAGLDDPKSRQKGSFWIPKD